MTNLLRPALAAFLLGLLTACANLPDDGPTVHAVRQGAAAPTANHYALVDVDQRIVQIIEAHPPTPLATLTGASSTVANDLIGEGDNLAVDIYQAGAGPLIGAGPEGGATNAAELLPKVVVGRDGDVTIPFAGEVHVIGLTPDEAAEAIQRALHGRALNPQVVVTVTTSLANSITVIGEVKNSGRYPISANNDRLLDVIAAAGGATQPAADLIVTVARDDKVASIPLNDLLDSPNQNIRLAPHDQVRVILHQRQVSGLGAVGRVTQFPIVDDHLTLAGALGRMGGLNTNTANSSALFVFRFERPEVAQALGVTGVGPGNGVAVPIVYRFNLKQGAGFFLAEEFPVQGGDLIDIPEANTTEIQKFFAIVNTAAGTFYQGAVISNAVP